MRILGLVVLYIAVALFGAAALAKLPHVLYGKRIAGQVVDADTDQPIAGAQWRSFGCRESFQAALPATTRAISAITQRPR